MTWQDCAACAKHGQLCFCPDCQKYHTAFFCQYWPSSLLSCLYSFSPLHFPFFPFYPWGFPGVSKSFFSFLLHTLLTQTPLHAKVPTEAQVVHILWWVNHWWGRNEYPSCGEKSVSRCWPCYLQDSWIWRHMALPGFKLCTCCQTTAVQLIRVLLWTTGSSGRGLDVMAVSYENGGSLGG